METVSSIEPAIAAGLTITINPSIHNISSPHVEQSRPRAVNHTPGVIRLKESPSSPQQWKASLESLSADLSRICRKSTGEMSPIYASKAPVFHSFDSSSSKPRRISGELTNAQTSPGCGDSLLSHCASNSIDASHGSVNRPVRVRHEETEFRLKQSLTAICGEIGASGGRPGPCAVGEQGIESGAKNSGVPSVTREGRVGVLSDRRSGNPLLLGDRGKKKSPHLQLKESLKSGVRLKLDMEALGGLENVAVCASGSERCVKVFSVGSSDSGKPQSTDSNHTESKSPLATVSESDTAGKSDDAFKEDSKKCSFEVGEMDETSHEDFVKKSRERESNVMVSAGSQLASTGMILDTCNVSILTATLVGSILYVRERPKAALLHYTEINSSCCENGLQNCGSSGLICGNGLNGIDNSNSGSPTFDGPIVFGNGSKISEEDSPSCGSNFQSSGNNHSEVSGSKVQSTGPKVGVPLIFEDEPAMKFTIILHVAPEYYKRSAGHSLGLLVKTVDDLLVIKGQGLVVDSAITVDSIGENEMNESLKLLEEIGRSRFSVAVTLPEGAQSRSVTAELSPMGQLIVRGRLSPASRRMTCDF